MSGLINWQISAFWRTKLGFQRNSSLSQGLNLARDQGFPYLTPVLFVFCCVYFPQNPKQDPFLTFQKNQMASCRVKLYSVSLKLPRFTLKHPQLVVGWDSKYLKVDKLTEKDFTNVGLFGLYHFKSKKPKKPLYLHFRSEH